MTVFSWQKAKEEAIKCKIERELNKCRCCANPSNEGSADKEFQSHHAGEVRDFGQKNNVVLKKRIKEVMVKHQELAIARRKKLV